MTVPRVSHAIALKVHFLREAHAPPIAPVVIIAPIAAGEIAARPHAAVVIHGAAVGVVPPPQISRLNHARNQIRRQAQHVENQLNLRPIHVTKIFQ